MSLIGVLYRLHSKMDDFSPEVKNLNRHLVGGCCIRSQVLPPLCWDMGLTQKSKNTSNTVLSKMLPVTFCWPKLFHKIKLKCHGSIFQSLLCILLPMTLLSTCKTPSSCFKGL